MGDFVAPNSIHREWVSMAKALIYNALLVTAVTSVQNKE